MTTHIFENSHDLQFDANCSVCGGKLRDSVHGRTDEERMNRQMTTTDKKTTLEISNCRRNIMGTVSFDGKCAGMRKPQDFIVYPMQDSGPNITIQSDHRFGQIDLDTGKGVLSANRAQYANAPWLGLCVINGTALDVELSTEGRETLRQWIKSTGGVAVGRSIVISDNTGALAL